MFKKALATVAFVFACVLVMLNMYMPPEGEVHSSIIYIFAQLLLFSATLLGVEVVLQKYLRDFKNK